MTYPPNFAGFRCARRHTITMTDRPWRNQYGRGIKLGGTELSDPCGGLMLYVRRGVIRCQDCGGEPKWTKRWAGLASR